MSRVVVVHPGAMGVTVASSFVDAGHDVCWVRDGRSAATVARAEAAGLAAVESLAEACDDADLVVSVCPPAAAVDVADAVASTRFAGTYLDANAISPATCETVVSRFDGSAVTVVDGSIIGLPAVHAGTTRLYLSGEDDVATLADQLSGGPLEVIAIDGGIGAASALKMAFAGWTKGSTALLLAVAGYADASGVLDALTAEWGRSIPGLADDLARRAGSTAPKAWRFVGEMEEIAASLDSAGLPDGLHTGAADLYRRMAGFKDAHTATLDEVLAALRAGR